MVVTPARIAASRANGARSRGPVTPEGKAISRGNALKHGLTAEILALPTENADAIERRLTGLETALQPRDELEATLVQRLAVAAIRLERAVRQETAALSSRIHSALRDHDENRHATVDALAARLETDPAALRKLRSTPEGIARLRALWLDLRGELVCPTGPRWSFEHARRFDALLGRIPGLFGRSETLEISEILLDSDDANTRTAANLLVEQADAELAALELDEAELDYDALHLVRANAPTRALFDPNREASLARRYEATAQREFYRALENLQKLRQPEPKVEPKPKPESKSKPKPPEQPQPEAKLQPPPQLESAPAPTPTPASASESSGSFGQEPEPSPEPAPTEPPVRETALARALRKSGLLDRPEIWASPPEIQRK
jgi:hypothetical protein